jgi:hypothetical protein
MIHKKMRIQGDFEQVSWEGLPKYVWVDTFIKPRFLSNESDRFFCCTGMLMMTSNPIHLILFRLISQMLAAHYIANLIEKFFAIDQLLMPNNAILVSLFWPIFILSQPKKPGR